MKKILTIGDLRQAIQHLNDHDVVVVEISEDTTLNVEYEGEDLYTIEYIDDSITMNDLGLREVRLCI
jgi:hypothetical protein